MKKQLVLPVYGEKNQTEHYLLTPSLKTMWYPTFFLFTNSVELWT